MKNTRFAALSFLLSVVFITSCTERYDVDLDNTYTRLVVDGSVTTDSIRHGVRLTTSTSYFYNEAPPAVSGAVVYVEDDQQLWQLFEVEDDPGYYQTKEAFMGKPGVAYQLKITLNEAIGGFDRFTATNTMPLNTLQIDSIVLEYREAFDFYLLNLFANDPPTENYYKFDAFINGKAITDTASRSLVVDDKFYNGNNTNGLSVMFLRGDELNPGDTLTLAVSSIDEDYFRFFQELRTGSGQSNPLFSGPAANIRSNVKEGALGYFSATYLTRASIVVRENQESLQ